MSANLAELIVDLLGRHALRPCHERCFCDDVRTLPQVAALLAERADQELERLFDSPGPILP